ncbi:hypothetical protein B0O79_0326 [Flavobacteriaceae bacterium MAR_2009_75]|nr:hypothetical protein B0O79_0326 [Flavobacteriaceae bacterium MAR_2009_75]
MKINKVSILVVLSALFITSCSDDDNSPTLPEEAEEPEAAYENGLLIVNEGPFNNGTGTVTFISEDNSVIEEAIYKKENSEDLGNIVQSMAFDDDLAYIVVNNSHKIHVVNRYTFKSEAVIEADLMNPRYMTVSNGKGYVTNWGDTADESDDYIAIIDLEANAVVGAIPVELGPEAITSNSEFVYVAHQGAYGQNNIVSVIDPLNDEVLDTIEVGDLPNSMQWDASGNLWVLSGGAPSYTAEETNGALVQIDISSNEISKTLDFTTVQHPGGLNIDGDMLYFSLDNAIYSFETNSDSLPTEPYINDVSFYTMTINEGKLYGTDAKDFASKGDLIIYDLSTKEKTNTFPVGIIPRGVYFN